MKKKVHKETEMVKAVKFNDTVTYEYKKNDIIDYNNWDGYHQYKMSTLYRHIVDSFDNSYFDVTFFKKENEPDSCWKLRDISSLYIGILDTIFGNTSAFPTGTK